MLYPCAVQLLSRCGRSYVGLAQRNPTSPAHPATPRVQTRRPISCPLTETSHFPLLGLTLAGSRFHGRVCTPGRLRRREAMLRETPPTPSGRPTSLRRQRSRQERRPLLHRSSASRLTPLRCSPPAAGAELAGCARSDSCAGLPSLLLRCSAVRKGLLTHTEPLLKRRGASTSWFGSVGNGCGWCRARPWDVGLRPAG